MLKKIYAQTSDRLGRINRKIWRNKQEKSNLKNTNFTIFSQNCIGGVMYHDLGEKFNSPTVNILFDSKDFIEFMSKIKYYLSCQIVFMESDFPYPIGKLGGEITIKFIHYHSEKEVIEAWNKRKQRINWDNIFVICCDEGLSYDDMITFDNLPYKNKVLFMHKNIKEIKCGIYCKEFLDKTDARLLNFANPLGKRYYQKYINYVKWINGEGYLN